MSSKKGTTRAAAPTTGNQAKESKTEDPEAADGAEHGSEAEASNGPAKPSLDTKPTTEDAQVKQEACAPPQPPISLAGTASTKENPQAKVTPQASAFTTWLSSMDIDIAALDISQRVEVRLSFDAAQKQPLVPMPREAPVAPPSEPPPENQSRSTSRPVQAARNTR